MSDGYIIIVSALTCQAALDALREALSPELRALLDTAPDPIRNRLVGLIVGGYATPAQAAEALTLADALGDATLGGAIDNATGLATMETLAHRHNGDVEAD